jgi:HEPN domain-containing protein
MSNSDANDHAQVEFFRLGVNYYVAGRFAALTGLFPIAGNLLHHAAEMLLKGALVRVVGLDKLRDIGHDLNDLWREFTTQFAISDSLAVDIAIVELDRFERLRYPDKVIHEGMEMTFDVYRTHRVETSGVGNAMPRYSLVLEDVDVLVKLIFAKAQVNPRFHLQKLRPEAMDFLSRENSHRLE